MLDNLSSTREYWHEQIKCASPPLSENEPDRDDPGNTEGNELPVEGTSTVVIVPKTITEESSMNCSEGDLQTCSIDGGDADTCSLQSSTDSLANMKRYVYIGEQEYIKRRGEGKGGAGELGKERGRAGGERVAWRERGEEDGEGWGEIGKERGRAGGERVAGREREGGEREREGGNTPYLLYSMYFCRISFKHIKGTKIGQEVPQDDEEQIIPASSNTV